MTIVFQVCLHVVGPNLGGKGCVAVWIGGNMMRIALGRLWRSTRPRTACRIHASMGFASWVILAVSLDHQNSILELGPQKHISSKSTKRSTQGVLTQ